MSSQLTNENMLSFGYVQISTTAETPPARMVLRVWMDYTITRVRVFLDLQGIIVKQVYDWQRKNLFC